MSLAEVHMTVGGPVDELVTAIKALDADLVKKAAKE